MYADNWLNEFFTHNWIFKSDFMMINIYFIFFSFSLFSVVAVQGSHRDSNKPSKDLSASSNLNNPNAVVGSNKNVAVASTATTDSDANRSGPYFDVAASKNVSTDIYTTWYKYFTISRNFFLFYTDIFFMPSRNWTESFNCHLYFTIFAYSAITTIWMTKK